MFLVAREPHRHETPVLCVPLCTTAPGLVSEALRCQFADRSLLNSLIAVAVYMLLTYLLTYLLEYPLQLAAAAMAQATATAANLGRVLYNHFWSGFRVVALPTGEPQFTQFLVAAA